MKSDYSKGLHALLRKKLIHRDMRVLAACGANHDRDVLLEAGFKNVTISNLDTRLKATDFAPFSWSLQDTENLTFEDGEFDFCIVHDGLHHCQSPHRALLELYRVAKTGLLAFEPRDSLIARIGVKFNFGQEYEVGAVFDHNSTFGGMRNTAVPNFVYRWTEREIEKTICSNAPWGRHRFIYFYYFRQDWTRFRMLKNKLWYLLMLPGFPLLKTMNRVFPRQTNVFGFAVFKPDPSCDLQPWMKRSGGEIAVNPEWFSSRYRKNESKPDTPVRQ